MRRPSTRMSSVVSALLPSCSDRRAVDGDPSFEHQLFRRPSRRHTRLRQNLLKSVHLYSVAALSLRDLRIPATALHEVAKITKITKATLSLAAVQSDGFSHETRKHEIAREDPRATSAARRAGSRPAVFESDVGSGIVVDIPIERFERTMLVVEIGIEAAFQAGNGRLNALGRMLHSRSAGLSRWPRPPFGRTGVGRCEHARKCRDQPSTLKRAASQSGCLNPESS